MAVKKNGRRKRPPVISVLIAGETVNWRPPSADDRARVVESTMRRIAWARRNYVQTRNPLYPWEAYFYARSSGVPLPSWVLFYFDRVAGELEQMWLFRPPMQGSIAVAATEALELKSRGRKGAVNPFAEIMTRRHTFEIAEAVLLKIQDGTKPDIAFDDVARSHPSECRFAATPCASISRTTVRRYWLQHRAELQQAE